MVYRLLMCTLTRAASLARLGGIRVLAPVHRLLYRHSSLYRLFGHKTCKKSKKKKNLSKKIFLSPKKKFYNVKKKFLLFFIQLGLWSKKIDMVDIFFGGGSTWTIWDQANLSDARTCVVLEAG